MVNGLFFTGVECRFTGVLKEFAGAECMFVVIIQLRNSISKTPPIAGGVLLFIRKYIAML